MATHRDGNKTKIAKRVIEVFEYFDDDCRRATVMDIVRRYGRPQSSTSELLASLVDLGLLYKDPRSRAYFPTPRLATLGASAQPGIVREGRLFALMDRLARSTRRSTVLFGMVGTRVQAFRTSQGGGTDAPSVPRGASVPLTASTAGLLMLAAQSRGQVAGMLWRLNAEAPADARFDPAAVGELVAEFRRRGWGTGAAGFAPGMRMTAVLLPQAGDERPLGLGLLHHDEPRADEAAADVEALVATLHDAIGGAEAREDEDASGRDAPLRMTG